jgi:hypothetical protein
MKKFNFFFTLKTALVVLCLAAVMMVSAQTAKVQLVHNAAAWAFDTVDIYVNGFKAASGMPFRSASSLQTLPAGTYLLNINSKNSTDSGNMVLARFAVTIAASSNTIIMFTGVDTPSNYAANPNLRSTAIKLVKLPAVAFYTSDPTKVALSFGEGITDQGAMSLKFRQGSALVTNAKFGDSSYFASTPANTLFAPASTSLLDVMDANNVLQYSYILPLATYSKKSLFFFASGFASPSLNQNGSAAGIFAVDTNGGPAWQLTTQGARLQVINAVADTSVDSIDVWLGNTKVISKLPNNVSSPVLTVVAGATDITLSRKNSTDTTTNVLNKTYGFTFVPGQTYLKTACGVIDTTKYAPNPDGVDRRLAMAGTSLYRESAQVASNVDIAFFNGSIDAPTVDVNRISGGGMKIANDIRYADASYTYVSITPGKYLITLTSKDSTTFYNTYLLDLTGKAGQSAVLFTSGMFGKTGNPVSAAPLSLNLAYAGGVVSTLKPLASTLQVVNNCADSITDSMDVYINGVKSYNGMGFRKCSPFITIVPYSPYSLVIKPKHSNSLTSALYTLNFVPDSGTGYYEVIDGSVAPSYVNPDNASKNTSYTVFTYKGAKATAAIAKNIDLLYHHGTIDLMATTMQTYNGAMFISKNDGYGDFHTPYSYNAALDNLEFDLMNANADTLLMQKAVGNISKRQGQAGLIFTSGFYHNLRLRDSLIAVLGDSIHNIRNYISSSQLARVLGLYIAWPDGKIDTIQNPALANLAVKQVSKNDLHASFYPNPASSVLNIDVDLPASTKVNIELYDISGRKILASSQAVRASGNRQLTLDLNGVVEGIYFCVLDANGQRMVKRVSVVR